MPDESLKYAQDSLPEAIHIDDHEAEEIRDLLRLPSARSIILNELTEAVGQEAITRALSYALCEILDAKKPKFHAGCMAFAINRPELVGYSNMTQFADAHGVVRATVSKWAKIYQNQFNLKPSACMKSEKACSTYKYTNGKQKGIT